jgi:fibro-slime domain-containing protein
LDLGGFHGPVDATLTLDSATAATLGLANGNVYEITVFQAQRQTTGSSMKITLPAFNVAPSACVKT